MKNILCRFQFSITQQLLNEYRCIKLRCGKYLFKKVFFCYTFFILQEILNFKFNPLRAELCFLHLIFIWIHISKISLMLWFRVACKTEISYMQSRQLPMYCAFFMGSVTMHMWAMRKSNMSNFPLRLYFIRNIS